MIQDGLKLKGRLNIVVTDPSGNIKDEREIDNVVVNDGKDFVASRMIGTASTVMSHMAIGTNSGSTAAAVGNTALDTESARVTFSSSPSVTDNDVTYVANFAAGTPSSATAVTEAGIFNASSGGTMLCRTVFNVINKGSQDALTITWTVTAS